MSNATQSVAAARINSLLDANSFVEIRTGCHSQSYRFQHDWKKAPSDGVITGYGVIDGSLVYVYSQDASVLNGTVGEMHAKKDRQNLWSRSESWSTCYRSCRLCGTSSSGRLPMHLRHLVRSIWNRHWHPVLFHRSLLFFGTCGGGMAVVPALTDFTFVEEKKGRLFVNTPNALEGNRVEKMRFSFRTVPEWGDRTCWRHRNRRGDPWTDPYTGQHASENNEDNDSFWGGRHRWPWNRVCDDIAGCTGDTAIVLSPRIAGNGEFFETKAALRPGCRNRLPSSERSYQLALLQTEANLTMLMQRNKDRDFRRNSFLQEVQEKQRDFVNSVMLFEIPVLTLTNVTGFKATLCNEKMMAKSVGEMVHALHLRLYRKVNVVIGKSIWDSHTLPWTANLWEQI